MNYFPLKYTLNSFQLASNNAVFKQTCQHTGQFSTCRLCVHFLKADLTSFSLLWKSLLKKNQSLQPELLFFSSSKTDFRLLPSRPPGRIRVTAGSRPVVAGRLSLREVRYQLAMLRRKRNRHSSPSVRPTTLAPPVHHLALRFLKMPYILSDRGPTIVFSHLLSPVVCSSLNDLTWLMITQL